MKKLILSLTLILLLVSGCSERFTGGYEITQDVFVHDDRFKVQTEIIKHHGFFDFRMRDRIFGVYAVVPADSVQLIKERDYKIAVDKIKTLEEFEN